MTVFRTKTICWMLTALGLVTSFCILWRHAVLAGLWPGGSTDLFMALFGVGHGEMLESPVVVQYGLPLAGWSLIYYATLAGFLLLGHILREDFAFEANLAAFLVSLPAFFISLFLGWMMFSGQAPFCRLCTLAHLNNLLLAFSLRRLTGHPVTQLIRALISGAWYLITGKTAEPAQARWKLVGLLTVALVALVLYQWVLFQVPSEASLNNPQRVLAKYETSTEQDIPVGPDDPILGSPSAELQLVVFSDFQCPTCDRYAGELHAMVDQYADKLQVVFKHFPLSKTCNPTMKINLHARACEAAYAAEAARKQGKFWPYHDKLFAADLRLMATTFNSLARDSGLDLDRFNADRVEESTKAKVQADIELANRLKIKSTPTLFLNRRPVSSIRPQDVRVLIHRLLQETGHGHAH